MDAIGGKLRKKKRGGLGIDDDSEDDDDNDEDKKRRRQMAKKRKIDGDNLEALSKRSFRFACTESHFICTSGKDPKTAPFHTAYRSAIDDDNAEFAYLQTEDQDFVMDLEEGGAANEESEDPPVTVSVHELRDQLRAAARENPVDDVSVLYSPPNAPMYSVLMGF